MLNLTLLSLAVVGTCAFGIVLHQREYQNGGLFIDKIFIKLHKLIITSLIFLNCYAAFAT